MSKKNKKDEDAALMEAAVLSGQYTPEPKPEPFDFDTFKLTKLEDFDVYNSHVRKHNRACVHEKNKMKIKVPDESFYKKFKTKFHRFQQMENVLKVRLRNKAIDWKGELKSGGTYMLPMPVITFLNKLATPDFSEVKVEHGNAVHTETRQTGETPRFSCNVLEYAA
jgi:hypothetical protein